MNNNYDKTKGKILVIISFTFLIAGIIMTLCSIGTIKDFFYKYNNYIEIDGKVISYIYKENIVKYVIVEYEVDGIKYTKQKDCNTLKKKRINDIVTLKYNPSNHSESILEEGDTTLVFPILGVVVLLSGIHLVIISLRKL